MPRYDYTYSYDRGFRDPYSAWYPGAFGGAPLYGWAGWGGAGVWGWPPYAPMGYGAYDRGYRPRVRPDRSPTYGRGGDEAVRRYAASHGYDAGWTIQPHGPARRTYGRYDRGGYDRGW